MTRKLALTVILVVFTKFKKAQTCNYNDFVLVCDNISGHKELDTKLQEALKEQDVSTFKEFTIQLSNLSNTICLPTQTIFKGVKSNVFSVCRSSLPFWTCPTDNLENEGFRKVKTLHLDDMDVPQNWDWEIIDRYTGESVETLEVTDSRWVRLPSSLQSFYGRHVKRICITNSGVRWLDDNSLSCPSCTFIKLEGNKIENVRKEIFGSGFTKLDMLNLKGSKIRFLPKDLFEKFSDISGTVDGRFRLLLTGNPLETFDLETFKPLKENPNFKMISIDFATSKKQLKCDCQLQWLSENPFYIENFYCDQTGATSNTKLVDYLLAECSGTSV